MGRMTSRLRSDSASRRRGLAAIGVILIAVIASCGGSTTRTSATATVAVAKSRRVPVVGTAATGAPLPAGPPEVVAHAGQWPTPNHDLVNSRSVGGSITSKNVNKLQVAWTAPISGVTTWGSFASAPIVVGQVVYTQDLASTVTAYDLATGAVKWRHSFPGQTSVGPNGVSIGYGKVYGATSDSAFALSAATGKLLWSIRLATNVNAGIDMAPAVFDHFVYVSTVPGNTRSFYRGGVGGVLYALDAATGKVKWQFATTSPNLWSKPSSTVNSGGGLWYQPAFSPDGSMYIDVANPAPFPGTELQPWGASRPGPNLYTDSLVKLDHATGKLIWYRQVLPHDVYDWDLQLPPVLAKAGGRSIVLAGGKMGYVYAFDAKTGRSLWKRAVGIHNGHDQDNLRALHGQSMPSLPVEVYPGDFGGILTPLAVSGGTVYVPIVDLPTTWTSQTDARHGTEHGELAALDLATGKVRWVTKLGDAAYGAATVTNDLVFTSTYDGHLYALDRATGAIDWSTKLDLSTNAPLTISGSTLIAAASVPYGNQSPKLVVYRLSGTQ